MFTGCNERKTTDKATSTRAVNWANPEHEWDDETTLLLVAENDSRDAERQRALQHLAECQKWYLSVIWILFILFFISTFSFLRSFSWILSHV
jgi:hypothetical protein